MAHEVVTWVMDCRPPGIKGGELAVLLAIAERADKHTGKCWPGQHDLARRTNLSERQVRNNLRKLVARGVLRMVRHGGNRTNDYFIVMDDPARGIGTALPVQPADTEATDRKPASGRDRNFPVDGPEVSRQGTGSFASLDRKPTSAKPLEPSQPSEPARDRGEDAVEVGVTASSSEVAGMPSRDVADFLGDDFDAF